MSEPIGPKAGPVQAEIITRIELLLAETQIDQLGLSLFSTPDKSFREYVIAYLVAIREACHQLAAEVDTLRARVTMIEGKEKPPAG